MTYCLSINTNSGLVLAAASCVNHQDADHQDRVQSNMHRFIWPGDRFIVILSSGNVATIDAVMQQVRHDINQENGISLRNIANMNEATDYIAGISAKKQTVLAKPNKKSSKFEANFILAGQIGNQLMETLLIYTQGNFIHESKKSPFLQIGEIKYGKPILDRMVDRNTSLERAARCAMVSIDSTLHSNPSTANPIELLIYRNNSLEMSVYQSFNHNHPFINNISQSWDHGITDALDNLPNFYWES